MDFDNDDELSSLMVMEQEQEDNNIPIPTQTGRTHPPPHDLSKHFAWGIYKSKKNKTRRPTCRSESCYKQFHNHDFEPPPAPPTAMAYGGKGKKKGMCKKKTRKNKYSSKKSQSNRFQKKTRKYK